MMRLCAAPGGRILAPMPATGFYYRMTNDIRVRVWPAFLQERSDPGRHRYVFAYRVRIENVGAQPARLLSRRWFVHDSIGEDTIVEGEGVVGEQPVIGGGKVHEYQSFCILKSPRGYMEGSYQFVRADGTAFDADIPRFILQVPAGGVLPS
jgi:ApaG protein